MQINRMNNDEDIYTNKRLYILFYLKFILKNFY